MFNLKHEKNKLNFAPFLSELRGKQGQKRAASDTEV